MDTALYIADQNEHSTSFRAWSGHGIPLSNRQDSFCRAESRWRPLQDLARHVTSERMVPTCVESAASHALQCATSCSSPRFSLWDAPQAALLTSASDLKGCHVIQSGAGQDG